MPNAPTFNAGAIGVAGHGAVNGADFLIWQRQFGLTTSLPATTAVLEPATLAWWNIALAAIGVSRRNCQPY